METARISGTDIETSRIGLGTWAIGGWMWGGTDEDAAVRAIRSAVDEGITLVDTAPVYGFGRSEEIVGKALAQGNRRQHTVLATKVGLNWSGDHKRIWREATRARVKQEVDDSLRRLRTDYIDIYQVHWPDPLTPLEETAHALQELLEAGKIRAVGVSNFSPEQMGSMREFGGLHTNQPPYNLFERQIEKDVLPYCARHGIATITYGALCRGMLSGRMHRDRVFEGDDLRNVNPKFRQPRFDQYLAAADALAAYARSNFGKSLPALAVRWLLDQPGHTAALWGARNPEQLAPVHEVAGWSLSDGDLERIEAILQENITDPVGPEFMAPPSRDAA
ncbi:aldo/keto reductase [Ectothiorhodospiraceae bacterium WFHF3C12]|nr:aldo/keto reductase [Ectothiorhodospiraceae bacterium WFHF3C12]